MNLAAYNEFDTDRGNAKRCGCSVPQLRAARDNAALPQLPKMDVAWHRHDWTLSLKVNAEMLGCSTFTVFCWRQHQAEFVPPVIGRKPTHAWELHQWTLPTDQAAALIGCSRREVARWRRRHDHLRPAGNAAGAEEFSGLEWTE